MRGLPCSYLSSSSKNTYKNRESLLQLESPSNPGTPLFLFFTVSPQWPAPKDTPLSQTKNHRRKTSHPLSHPAPVSSSASHYLLCHPSHLAAWEQPTREGLRKTAKSNNKSPALSSSGGLQLYFSLKMYLIFYINFLLNFLGIKIFTY